MPEDAIRNEVVQSREHEAERGDQPAEAVKKFVKPTLTRHDSLPRVTTLLAGGGSP